MSNKIQVTFYIDGREISSKEFGVNHDNMVPIPADCLFAFINAELRIKAIEQDHDKQEYNQSIN